MDEILELIAEAQLEDEPQVPDESIHKKIVERVAELDSLLVDIHASAAIEERGLSSLLRNLVPICYFLNFQLCELSSENLLFYLEVEHYKKKILTQADSALWISFATQLNTTYIKSKSPLEINIVSPVRDAVQQALSPESLDAGEEGLVTVFDACQKACFALMLDTWKRFLGSAIYSNMMTKLRTFSLSDTETKKDAIRQVLGYFKDGTATHKDEEFDFLGDGRTSVTTVIKEKTMEFLRRSNVFNNEEFDPDFILQNWDATRAKIYRAVGDYTPNAGAEAPLTFKKGALVLVEDMAASGTWQGKLNGTGPSGFFPSNLVEPSQLNAFPKTAELSINDGEDVYSIKVLLPKLFKSIVQSCSQIIHTANPPVASWVLDGLIGTILSVCQVVGAADSISQRIYMYKDVRWLQHCSTQVVQHLKTLVLTVEKAYITSDTRSRNSNPNFLSLASMERTLGVVTDLIRSTKELATAAIPIINGYLATPSASNVGPLMKILCDRATIVELRKSLESSQAFLVKSLNHMKVATEVNEDAAYVARSTMMILIASLQVIEAVSGLSQLDQKINQATIDGITSLHKNGLIIHEQTIKVLADQLTRTSVKEYLQRIERHVKLMSQVAASLLEELSAIQSLSEQSVPESGAEHSDTEPVDALTKVLVGNMSEFLRAVSEGRKSELILMTDHVSDAATKLGNKIVFELKNLGISGVKKLEELKSDGWELIAGKAALSKSFTSLVIDSKQQDMEALMKANVKELAQSIMALIPGGEVEAGVPKRKKAMDGCVQALKIINNLAYRISDLTANDDTRRTVKKWNAALTEGLQRLDLAIRDVSGLIPSAESIAELKSACTNILGITKQLSTTVYAAMAEPDFGTGVAAEESYDGGSEENLAGMWSSPFDPRSKPVSPFDSGVKKGPVSPFDVGKGLSPSPPGMPPMLSKTGRSPSARAQSGIGFDFNPLKMDLNVQLTIIGENVAKLRTDATLAAGVWPPPQVYEDIKQKCQNIAKAVKSILSSFESITSGERDRKEKELALQLGQWKTFRLQIHANLISLSRELYIVHERKQTDNIEERKQYHIKKQEKHQTPSKVWMEKASNTDYEKWYKGFCTEEVLRDPNDDVEFDSHCDKNDPKPINVKSGSLYGLVRMLTYHKYPDPEYTHAFLLSYRSFTSTEELLSLIIERYNISPPEDLAHPKQLEYYYVRKIVPVRMRVSNFIRTWLEDHFEDFAENDSALLKQLNEFIDNQMQVTDDNLAQLLRKTISKKLEGKDKVIVKTTSNPPEIILSEKWFGNETKLVDISPLEIARQLSLIDFKIFSTIQAKEFLNQAWSKEALKARSPNLRAMIKRSNDLTYSTATEILLAEDLETRQGILLQFIQIADKCFELNSFNCVLAIYSGLTSSPIHRLKKTWEILEAKENAHLKAAWKRLEDFTDSSGNHANYRNTLHSINPPCVPFLGQYLTDLVFIDDGNPDTTQYGDKAFINFQKRLQTSAVIREVQQFQQIPYNFKDWTQLIKYLLRTTNLLDDSQLYKQSLKVEPRAKA